MEAIYVEVKPSRYPVLIRPGAVGDLGGLESVRKAGRVAVIADERVAAIHRNYLATALSSFPCAWITVPAGESCKNLPTLATIYDQLSEAHVQRHDLVIAVGGGATTDVAGFAAATWMRGVPLVLVPTTLEGALDASVGGKTAINHASGKNLIGAFHQPAAVLVDLTLLATLPQRDFVAGLAESVKHAAIREPALLDWHEQHADALLRRDPGAVTELVARNVEIKASVVAADERERDLRAILNYGHTIGHAVEHVCGHQLRHGECVSLGIVAENEIAVQRQALDRGDAQRIGRLLSRLGLPTCLAQPLPPSQVLRAAYMDKKNRGGRITCVLLARLGVPMQVDNVLEQEIVGAVELLCLGNGEKQRREPQGG